jgi:hypothetical protein|tara:strand:- start:470 stop:685 length:216 start_codon:yes stop_codon:yes gene_type:complete
MTYQKKLEEAPYHPGYEDAVVPPTPKYTGMNPSKMLWKSKPLTNDEIVDLRLEHVGIVEFARAIEERHGIK